MKKPRNLRVALLIHDLIREGGGERQFVNLAYELAKQDHKITIFTSEYAPANCFPDICKNLEIKVIGKSHLSKKGIPLYGRIKEFLDMKKMAKHIDGSYDILNPHAWPTHWAAGEVKKKYDTPVVWMCNDFMIPKVIKTSPLNATKRLSANFANQRRALLFSYDLPVVKKIEKVLVLSKQAKATVSSAYRIDPIIVRSGIDLEKYSSNLEFEAKSIRLKYHIDESAFLLLNVSIPLPHRRLEDFIDAIERLSHKNIMLLHVGSLSYDPIYSQKIVSFVKEKNLEDRVVFAGSVPEKELSAYYQACDAFVFPNKDQTWGLAVTEAMASGKPVVVSTGAGVHEILSDGENALLIPPEQPDRLAESIEALIDNPALAARIAANGKRLVNAELSWEKYTDGMVDIFQDCIRGN